MGMNLSKAGSEQSPPTNEFRPAFFHRASVPMIAIESQNRIRAYFDALHRAWGPQHWWPARTRFEVIVGAYLTQNTSWKNVEIALRQLRAAHKLSLAAVRTIPLDQ